MLNCLFFFSVRMNWMPILVGPTASGKTSLVRLLARLSGHTLYAHKQSHFLAKHKHTHIPKHQRYARINTNTKHTCRHSLIFTNGKYYYVTPFVYLYITFILYINYFYIVFRFEFAMNSGVDTTELLGGFEQMDLSKHKKVMLAQVDALVQVTELAYLHTQRRARTSSKSLLNP